MSAHPSIDRSTLAELPQRTVRPGSRTHNQHMLTALSSADAFQELLTSRLILEDRLNRGASSLAGPYGPADGAIQRLVGAAVYDFAYTTHEWWAHLARDTLKLQRLEVHGGRPIEDFAILRLASAALSCDVRFGDVVLGPTCASRKRDSACELEYRDFTCAQVRCDRSAESQSKTGTHYALRRRVATRSHNQSEQRRQVGGEGSRVDWPEEVWVSVVQKDAFGALRASVVEELSLRANVLVARGETTVKDARHSCRETPQAEIAVLVSAPTKRRADQTDPQRVVAAHRDVTAPKVAEDRRRVAFIIGYAPRVFPTVERHRHRLARRAQRLLNRHMSDYHQPRSYVAGGVTGGEPRAGAHVVVQQKNNATGRRFQTALSCPIGSDTGSFEHRDLARLRPSVHRSRVRHIVNDNDLLYCAVPEQVRHDRLQAFSASAGWDHDANTAQGGDGERWKSVDVGDSTMHRDRQPRQTHHLESRDHSLATDA
jgi:hypothetical protein